MREEEDERAIFFVRCVLILQKEKLMINLTKNIQYSIGSELIHFRLFLFSLSWFNFKLKQYVYLLDKVLDYMHTLIL